MHALCLEYALAPRHSYMLVVFFLMPCLILQFMFLTGGVVFLTLIINGTTTQFLLALLKMNKTSDVKVVWGAKSGTPIRD